MKALHPEIEHVGETMFKTQICLTYYYQCLFQSNFNK